METNEYPAVSAVQSRDPQICDLLGYDLGRHPQRNDELAVN